MNAPNSFPGKFGISVHDAASFSTSKLSPITHTYHRHPLMQIDRLELLAKSLVKTSQCRFVSPGVEASSPFNHKSSSPDGRNIEEVFRQISTPGSWVALYDVESDPEYREFLAEVMGTVRHLIEPDEKINDIRGFIFISAHPSVTPFHIDRENNFWLQIRGQKTITLWDRTDRDIVSARDVENFIVYKSLDNVRLRNEFHQRSHEFRCKPGDGVYFPSTTPHTTRSEPNPVETADPVAISIGINFYTDRTRRNAYVHTTNGVLRRLGLKPRPPEFGADRAKYFLGKGIVALRRLSSGYVPPPGF